MMVKDYAVEHPKVRLHKLGSKRTGDKMTMSTIDMHKKIAHSLTERKRKKEALEQELKGMPKGALVKKTINGNDYAYEVRRIQGKRSYIYLGKYSEEYMVMRKRKKEVKAGLRELKKDIHKLERCKKILSLE